MSKPIVINFFGSAGSGKSTNSAGLAYKLKKDGYKVELVTEYARDLDISKTEHILANQRMYFLQDSDLDFIITD